MGGSGVGDGEGSSAGVHPAKAHPSTTTNRYGLFMFSPYPVLTHVTYIQQEHQGLWAVIHRKL